jgi:hypothetical protein
MSAISSYASATSAQHTQRKHRHGGPEGAQGKADFAAAAKALGVDETKVDDIQKQVESAITSARQGGANKTESRQAVQAAIEGVLKDNGIDPAKFKEQIDKQRAARGEQVGGARPQTATRGVPQFAGGGSDADGDGDNDAGNGKVDVYG